MCRCSDFVWKSIDSIENDHAYVVDMSICIKTGEDK